jgi:hypothetical protein
LDLRRGDRRRSRLTHPHWVRFSNDPKGSPGNA